MEGQFDDLLEFLMHDQEETAEQIFAGDGIDNNDHMMPTGTITSGFSDCATDDHYQLEEPDWFTQYSDLHFTDNQPSNEVYPDNHLFFDVTQENDNSLIDQYIHDNETLPLQHQAEYSHHPHGSTSRQPQLLQVQDREPVVERTKSRRKKGKRVLVVNHVEEEEEEEEDEEALGAAEADAFVTDLIIDNDNNDDDNDDDDEDDNQTSKNLVSERNRRKRLNEQLFKLRGIVPNITKMDKRSVLVDALAYLQDILHQTEIEQNRINNISTTAIAMAPDSSPVGAETDQPPCYHIGVVTDKNVVTVEGQPQLVMMSTVLEPSIAPYSAIFPAITEVEAEKVAEDRYLLKIVCNKAPGTMNQVQRSVEMLKGFDFITVSVNEYGHHHMQFSTFLRVKKIKGSLLVTDAEDLLVRVKTTAKLMGLRLPCAASSA